MVTGTCSFTVKGPGLIRTPNIVQFGKKCSSSTAKGEGQKLSSDTTNLNSRESEEEKLVKARHNDRKD